MISSSLSLAGGFIFGRDLARHSFVDSQEIRETGYKFISPLLECESYFEENPSLTTEINEALIKKIEQLKQDPKLENIGVYYRDLNNGPILNLHNDIKFAVASLFKVPLLMSAYKYAQTHPDFLTNTITYKGQYDHTRDPEATPEQTLMTNTTYTINELLQRMIVHSDNISKDMLKDVLAKLDPELHSSTLKTIGLLDNLQNINLNESAISVKDYATVFRILYNASYLNHDMSEKALSLLSQTNFEAGIAHPIPQQIAVAHKFGYRNLANNANNGQQLHDCGIVYLPKSPYLLCVMTRGQDLDTLSKAIQDISQVIWQLLTQSSSPTAI